MGDICVLGSTHIFNPDTSSSLPKRQGCFTGTGTRRNTRNLRIEKIINPGFSGRLSSSSSRRLKGASSSSRGASECPEESPSRSGPAARSKEHCSVLQQRLERARSRAHEKQATLGTKVLYNGRVGGTSTSPLCF